MTPEELAEMLFKSLTRADAALMRVIARQAVNRFAGMEPGRPVAAPTTCTARCGTSTSTACWRSSGAGPRGRGRRADPAGGAARDATSTRPASSS